VSAPHTLRLRALLAKVRPAAGKRGATNPRIFGSVATGTAVDDSDIDLIVDFPGALLNPGAVTLARDTPDVARPLMPAQYASALMLGCAWSDWA
jgi:tRNA nucleotidyltransferase (CCA-adding enzyme)